MAASLAVLDMTTAAMALDEAPEKAEQEAFEGLDWTSLAGDAPSNVEWHDLAAVEGGGITLSEDQ